MANTYNNSYSAIYLRRGSCEKIPLPQSSCCIYSQSCPCPALAHRVPPIMPSFLGSLRQSTLIQLSAPGKPFLPVAAVRRRRWRYYCYYRQLPIYNGPDTDRGRRELSCAESRGSGSLYPKAAAEEKSRRRGSRAAAVGDAEALLSLLAEGAGEKGWGSGDVGERVWRVRRRWGRGNVVSGECFGGERGLGLSSSAESCKFEPVQIRSGEVENRRGGEREPFPNSGDTSSVRRGSPSCSSRSFSSSEDFESESEVQGDRRGSVGVSLDEFAGDLGGNGVGQYYELGKEEHGKCRDDAGEHSEQITGPTNAAGARSIDWDWRKKSEKKLTEVVTDQENVIVEMAHRVPSNPGNGPKVVYASQKHDREAESNLDERTRKQQYGSQKYDREADSNLDERTMKQYGQIGIRTSGASESRRKYQQHAQRQEVSRHKLRSTDIFQQKLNGKKENLGVAENLSHESRNTHGQGSSDISGQQELGKNSQNLLTASEVHERTSNSNRRSEMLRKNQEKPATLVLDERTRNQLSQVHICECEISESRREHPPHAQMQEVSHHNLQSTYLSQQKRSSSEENLVVADNLSHKNIGMHAQDDYYMSCQHDSGRNTQQLSTVSEVHERTSNSNKDYVTLRKNQEKKGTLLLNSNKETAEQQCHQTSQLIVNKIDSRRKFQQSTEVLNFEDTNIEHTSSSQRQSDSIMSNWEENLNLVVSLQPEPEQQRFELYQKEIKRNESSKGSQASIMSVGTSKKMRSEEGYLESVDEMKDRHDQTDGRALHIDSRIETQKPKLSSLRKAHSGEAFRSQAPLKLEGQLQVEQTGVAEEGERSSQTIMMPPQSQLVTRGVSETQECFSEISGSGRRAFYPCPQGMKLDLHLDLQDKSIRHDNSEEPLNLLSHQDVLSSASHQEKSSMEFVGDYVDKIRSEVTASEIQRGEKIYKSNFVYGSKEHKQKGLDKHGSGNLHSKKADSKQSSSDFGKKGPSDSMSYVLDPAVLEVSETGASEVTASDKNSIVKRSSRSLWNIIGDIVRLRWGSDGNSHNLAGKLGAKWSSDESLSSEAWFSSHELDEKNDEKMTRKPREPTSGEQLQAAVTHGQSQRYGSDTRSSMDDESRYFEADIPSSSSALHSHSGSRGKSPASRYENNDSSEDGKSLHGTSSMPSPMVMESSISLPSKGLRSPILDSGSTEKMEQPVNPRLVEGLGIEGKDTGLNQRKLLRKNQVMKDTFDEWEEAYKLEREQRKIDEMFMREAILEAKKAADSWEVPVGAVLVQHGKVIARGCNLVEELRDSTAHAEMICIRGASNILRSWRLADTTLYVTLEPCPMCAGAILQARIKTVVWGTANKLLGADGSWIRLFPGGESGNGLERTDMPAAPVHPFHPNMIVRRGVLAAECADAMQHFFQLRRRKKEKKPEPPTPPRCLPVVHHPSKFLSKMHHILHIMFCL